MNHQSQDRFSEMVSSQMQTDMEQLDVYEAKQAWALEHSEEKEAYERTIRDLTSSIETYQQIMDHVNNGDWMKVYEEYSKVLKFRISLLDQSNVIDDEDTASMDMASDTYKQLTYIDYLKNHSLNYEDQDFPIYGMSFMTSIAQFILPVLITIACIYILTQLFTLDYTKDCDISRLYPLSRGNVLCTKLLVGIGFSILIYSLILLFSFLVSTLFSFHGGFQYPILIKEQATGTWSTICTLTLFKEWHVVGFLFYICLTLFMNILSIFIREDVYLLIMALGVILGIAYLPMIIREMMAIAHVLPTTYMNFVNVANGNLATQYVNTQISTSTGIWVLIIFTIVESIYCFLWSFFDRIHMSKR